LQSANTSIGLTASLRADADLRSKVTPTYIVVNRATSGHAGRPHAPDAPRISLAAEVSGGTVGATLKDVASDAGVSVKTVSNVVNGYAHVRPDTRSRVQHSLTALGYRPNASARALRTGQSRIIALALPELDIPYFAELTRHVIGAAAKRSWTVLIDQTEGLAERERFVGDEIRSQLIAGLIANPVAIDASELLRGARTQGIPVVLLGERVEGGSADHVAIDNVKAAQEATTHLIDLGRRRIAAIGAKETAFVSSTRLRLEGYRRALTNAGRAVDGDLIIPTKELHRPDGADATRRLLDLARPPDAIFCFNDLIALGALRALAERGVRVPDDVAIVGFDDIEDGRFSTPSLTTISPDKAGIARVAVSLLLDRLAGRGGGEPREVVADHRLITRESTLGTIAAT
jgi:DNA-binding LacI/PurR family transcriptional regulator